MKATASVIRSRNCLLGDLIPTLIEIFIIIIYLNSLHRYRCQVMEALQKY